MRADQRIEERLQFRLDEDDHFIALHRHGVGVKKGFFYVNRGLVRPPYRRSRGFLLPSVNNRRL